jgi:hypothetical protein
MTAVATATAPAAAAASTAAWDCRSDDNDTDVVV